MMLALLVDHISHGSLTIEAGKVSNMFLMKVSYAHQACIYFIHKSKIHSVIYLKKIIMFSILVYFKCNGKADFSPAIAPVFRYRNQK